jgi:hypothetical protein
VSCSREQQDERAEPAEHEEVKRAIERDQPQHELVAQRLASQRQFDLLALGRADAGGLLGASQREPAVAAQTAIPALSGGVLARKDRVLGAQLARVRADQLVPAHAADQKLPVKAWAKAARSLCAWWVRCHGQTVPAAPARASRQGRSAILGGDADLARRR